MSVIDRLESLFLSDGVRYELFDHPLAISAQRAAQVEHVPGAEEAKVVVLRADGRHVMAVLPATHHVQLEKMKDLLEVEEVNLENQKKLESLFSDCEVGAMPPFGHLYGLPIVVDSSLAKSRHIVFNAGSHTEAIRMTYADYARIANPLVGDFAVRNS